MRKDIIDNCQKKNDPFQCRKQRAYGNQYTRHVRTLTISVFDEKSWGLVSIDLFDGWSMISVENFRFNSGDGGTCCLLAPGGFDRPTEPGKNFGTIEISFFFVSNCRSTSLFDDGNVSAV